MIIRFSFGLLIIIFVMGVWMAPVVEAIDPRPEPTSPSDDFPDEPTPLPEAAECGVAGNEETNVCCDIQDPYAVMGEQVDNAGGNQLPNADPGFFSGVIRLLLGNTEGSDPMMNAITPRCFVGQPSRTDDGGCICVTQEPVREFDETTKALESVCHTFIVPDEDMPVAMQELMVRERENCFSCATIGGYYSSIGCVPADLSAFIAYVLTIGIGLAGVLTLGCIIYSAFLLQISRGEPEAIQKAREQLVSCILGLIMIIFSVFILEVIGVEILRLPGFTSEESSQEPEDQSPEDPEQEPSDE